MENQTCMDCEGIRLSLIRAGKCGSGEGKRGKCDAMDALGELMRRKLRTKLYRVVSEKNTIHTVAVH